MIKSGFIRDGKVVYAAQGFPVEYEGGADKSVEWGVPVYRDGVIFVPRFVKKIHEAPRRAKAKAKVEENVIDNAGE